jgi:hypothetical protein
MWLNNRHFTWRPVYIFIMPYWILLRMRHDSDKSFKENQSTNFMVSNFFRKSCRSWNYVEKIVDPGKQFMIIWFMCIACRITKATDTHSQYVTHYFSTATAVARTHRNVTLYVKCPSCLRWTRTKINCGNCFLDKPFDPFSMNTVRQFQVQSQLTQYRKF